MAFQGLSSSELGNVHYMKSKLQQQQGVRPSSSRLLLGYLVPFLLGLSVGCCLVLMLSWGSWREESRMDVFIQVAPAPDIYHRTKSRLLDGEEEKVKEVGRRPNSWHRVPLVGGCPEHPLQLLILVLSAPDSSLRRMAIRGTWMHHYSSRKVLSTTRFLVGLLNLPEEQLSSLREEQDVYQDLLLLEDLKDSYLNLSAKVLLGLEWSQAENVDFDYLVKTDDDSYVRIEAVSEALRQMECQNELYWGYFMGHAFPEPTGKWMERNWFKCPHYFPYAMGGGYVLSRKLVETVTRFSERLILYSNEDVTVSSWLSPYRLLRKHDLRFNVESLSHGCNNRYIISHKERVRSFYEKYSSLSKNRTLCSEEKEIRPAYVYNWTSSPLDCCERIKGLPLT